MEKTLLTKTEILRQLFKDHGLIYNGDPNSKDNDIFKHKHFTIITRSGIEKIQKSANIIIRYDVVYVSESAIFLKAYGTRLSKEGVAIDSVETFASASKDTSTSAYYPEMAEKRAMSRVVLKLAGLYEYGVYGADEADEFKEAEKKRGTTGATYKGEQ